MFIGGRIVAYGVKPWNLASGGTKRKRDPKCAGALQTVPTFKKISLAPDLVLLLDVQHRYVKLGGSMLLSSPAFYLPPHPPAGGGQ